MDARIQGNDIDKQEALEDAHKKGHPIENFQSIPRSYWVYPLGSLFSCKSVLLMYVHGFVFSS